MASAEQITELREMIGEVIPDGGSAADTLFTDTQITAWVDAYPSMTNSALKGWQIKMARYADLVNVTDGAASREMSDLFEHAKDMVKMYSGLAAGPTAGRSRVGRIVRE